MSLLHASTKNSYENSVSSCGDLSYPDLQIDVAYTRLLHTSSLFSDHKLTSN